MKAATKLLLALAFVCAMVFTTTTRGEEGKKEEPKTVTLKGELQCTKCSLGETKKCGNCIKVTEGKKDVIYYLVDKGAKEKYHGKICTSPAKGSVTGVVKKDKDRLTITPVKDGVKYD